MNPIITNTSRNQLQQQSKRECCTHTCRNTNNNNNNDEYPYRSRRSLSSCRDSSNGLVFTMLSILLLNIS